MIFNDVQNIFRNKAANVLDKYMQGSKVILRNGAGTLLATLNIQYGKPLNNNQFHVEISDRDGEINSPFTKRITLEDYPNCVQAAFDNDAIEPIVLGEVVPASNGTLEIYQVSANNYLISGNQDETVTIDSAFLGDDTDITGSCAVSTPADGKTYITYSITDPDSIFVNVTRGSYKSGDPQDVLEQILEKHAGYSNPNYDTNSSLATLLANIGYTDKFRGYAIMEDYTISQVRKDFAESHNVDCITDKTGQTKVKFIDLNDLSVPELKYFQEGCFKSFTIHPEPDAFENRILSKSQYNYRNKTYLKDFLYSHNASQSRFGIKNGEINSRFVKVDEITVFNAKYSTIFTQNPREKIVAEFTNINHFIDRGVELGDLIKIKHSDARTTDFRLYQVRQINADYQNDKLIITCYDYTFLEDINTETNLISRGSGNNGYLDHFDYAINTESGNHILNPALSIINADTEVLFFDSSIYAWGSRRITSPDKAEWDLFGSLTDSKTLNIYHYPIDYTGTHSTKLVLAGHYQDVNNWWSLQIETSTQVLRLLVHSGGVDVIDISSTNTMPINNWYCSSLIKVGQDIGIYINQNQENYVSLSGSTYNFSGLLFLYGIHPLARYYQGYVAENVVTPKNYYNVTPNVGLTASIVNWWHPMNEKCERVVLACHNPRADEQIQRGKIYRINWNIPNIWVKVELYDNAGTPGFVKTISSSVGNDMFYDWKIDSAETIAERRVKITSLDGNISAFSELFDITA